MAEKIHISWNEFHQDVKDLCAAIRKSGDYNKIVAISRGGLLPAGIIAYELDIRNTAVLNVATYVGDKHLKLDKISGADMVGVVDEKTLIIDDLADSGQTFNVLRKQFAKGTFVTVYAKEKGKKEVDLFVREMPDAWIVFPWDVE